jgi:hypothetical protein
VTRRLTDKRGNLLTFNTHDDVRRIEAVIRRLFNAQHALPGVRSAIDERIQEAVEAQGQGGGSGVSDTVARAAEAIRADTEQHRRLNRAMRGVEDAVEHLRVESERSLGKLTAAEPEHHQRCPKPVLLRQTVQTADGPMVDEVMRPCNHLTAHKVDENGNAIAHDPDGYCEVHRAEANEAMRRAQIEQRRFQDSNSRRLRKYRNDLAG